MHLALLSILLARLVATNPTVATLHARDNIATIYDNINFEGEHQDIAVNDTCVNLKRPLCVNMC